MIPKKIHYCWFGESPLSEVAKKYIDTWKKYCPDYEIIEWNEKNFDITQNQYCQEAYEAKKWAFVSDYARLKILYEYGGIYMDTDVEVLRSLDGLLKYNWFSGFESDIMISTATMGGIKNSKVLKLLLDDYTNRHFIKYNGGYDLRTNVEVITKILKENYNIQLNNTYQIFGDNNTLFPFDYLCCKNLINGKIYKCKDTYTIHHFNGSWLTFYQKRKINLQRIFSFIFGVEKCMKLKTILKGETRN